jgi:hypothetical protein
MVSFCTSLWFTDIVRRVVNIYVYISVSSYVQRTLAQESVLRALWRPCSLFLLEIICLSRVSESSKCLSPHKVLHSGLAGHVLVHFFQDGPANWSYRIVRLRQRADKIWYRLCYIFWGRWLLSTMSTMKVSLPVKARLSKVKFNNWPALGSQIFNHHGQISPSVLLYQRKVEGVCWWYCTVLFLAVTFSEPVPRQKLLGEGWRSKSRRSSSWGWKTPRREVAPTWLSKIQRQLPAHYHPDIICYILFGKGNVS